MKFSLKWSLVCERRTLALGFLISVSALGACTPRFQCPARLPPSQGAYSHLPTDGSRAGFPAGARHAYYNKSDSQIVIDPACSTLCIDDEGEGGETAISGTIDLTIGPECTEPRCLLTIAEMNIRSADFTVGGHQLSQFEGWLDKYSWGIWEPDNTIALPRETAFLAFTFLIDGSPGGITATNFDMPLWGHLDAGYNNFSLAGNLNPGVHLSLCGYPVAHPPVAVLTPSGPFQADENGVAHVTFSSEQSHDPDGDILHRRWMVDRSWVGGDDVTFQTTLAVGSHTISVAVIDSRGAMRAASVVADVLQ